MILRLCASISPIASKIQALFKSADPYLPDLIWNDIFAKLKPTWNTKSFFWHLLMNTRKVKVFSEGHKNLAVSNVQTLRKIMPNLCGFFQNILTLQLHSECKAVITSFNRIFKISFGDSTFDVVSFRLVIPLLNLSWCTISFSIARLACALCTIFSSIVFWVISRNITTGRVWPIRWHRSIKKEKKIW